MKNAFAFCSIYAPECSRITAVAAVAACRLCGANGRVRAVHCRHRTYQLSPAHIRHRQSKWNKSTEIQFNFADVAAIDRHANIQTPIYSRMFLCGCNSANAIAINISHWSMREISANRHSLHCSLCMCVCLCAKKKSRKIFTAMLKAFYTICTTIETEPNADRRVNGERHIKWAIRGERQHGKHILNDKIR